ncbi:MAG: hypothetical protein SynsKO_36870 [Synoicihabitans sp.]
MQKTTIQMLKAGAFSFFFAIACEGQPVGIEQAEDTFRSESGSRAITYVIAHTDLLRVEIFQEDDLGTLSRVDSEGRINLRLMEPISVVGLTLETAEQIVEESYQAQRLIRDPQVTITVEEYAPRVVLVQGEVTTPGRIPLPVESGMTVLDAITRAGGLTDMAKGEAVNISRSMPDGSTETRTVNIRRAIKGLDSAKFGPTAILLLPDDIVYVPTRIFL